ncbi:MAG TPA: alpha/beta hydrolase [Pseudolysinimonas sp.]|nr:alpha/beta hydrolase [Pseudolysinimonas sp.]
MAESPTVVLVHGAFADAGSWAGVTAILQAAGVTVLAPANPLRGVTSDSAYIASVISQIDGPVLAVGHSYGGAVITNAGTAATNVVGLVYISAFAPDEGEKLSDVTATSADSILGAALQPRQFPTGSGGPSSGDSAVELYVDPAKFHEVFAADLPVAQSAVFAASQRPVAASAFDEVNGVPAWKTLPSWAVVGTGDKAAGADVTREHAQRAGSQLTELDGSHLAFVAQPQAVADVILTAWKAVTK